LRSGRVHKHIYAAQAIACPSGPALRAFQGRRVTRQELHLSSRVESYNGADRSLTPLDVAPKECNPPHTCHGKLHGGFEADPGGAAGDEDGAVLQQTRRWKFRLCAL
jgi:hypothetical protein